MRKAPAPSALVLSLQFPSLTFVSKTKYAVSLFGHHKNTHKCTKINRLNTHMQQTQTHAKLYFAKNLALKQIYIF